MKWFAVAVAVLVVGGNLRAEYNPGVGSHGTQKGYPQMNASYGQRQVQKQDPFIRLSQLVNACLADRGNLSRNNNLRSSGR